MSEQEANEAAAMYWEHGTGSQIECDGKGQPTGFVRVPCVLHDAVTTIADAYLAEHPADDGDAVTEIWLDSLELDVRCGLGYVLNQQLSIWLCGREPGIYFHNGEGDGFRYVDEHDEDRVGAIRVLGLKSKGQLKEFCRTFGIQLKESS